MEFLALIFIITLILAIILPLVYWFVLNRRSSRVFVACKFIRKFFALIIAVWVVVELYQLPLEAISNPTRLLRETIKLAFNTLWVFLLWRNWSKTVRVEAVGSEQNKSTSC